MRKSIAIFIVVGLLLIQAKPVIGESSTYVYDENGNLISDGEQCFDYNDANKMAAVSDCETGQLIAEYVYDHTGQRIVEKLYENGILTTTVYTIGGHSETIVAAEGEREDTTYLRINDQLVAKANPDTSSTFYLSDHLGSTSILTDDAGELVEETRYYPFGEIRTGGIEGRYLYTGQEFDNNTILYYYGARYYDPLLNRFAQADPLISDPHNPQLLNRYSYVLNAPINYTDPTGYSAQVFQDENGEYWMDFVDDDSATVEGLDYSVQMNDYERIFSAWEANERQSLKLKVLDNTDIARRTWPNVYSTSSYYRLQQFEIIYSESQEEQGFDYQPGLSNEAHVFVIDGDAYNDAGAGNYLWARTLRGLGIPRGLARFGAWFGHVKDFEKNLTSNDRSVFRDSPADSRAIDAAYGQ